MHNMEEMRVVGRFAMPLFFFLIGYSQSYRFKFDVLVWAIILLLVDIAMDYPIFPLNILFSVLVARMVMVRLVAKERDLVQLWVLWGILMLWYLPLSLVMDYGAMTIVIAFAGYMTASERYHFLVRWAFIGTAFVIYVLSIWQMMEFSLFSLVFLIVGFLPLSWYLARYRIITFGGIVPVVFEVPLKFIGRYSLEVYALHVIVLKVVALIYYSDNIVDYPSLL